MAHFLLFPETKLLWHTFISVANFNIAKRKADFAIAPRKNLLFFIEFYCRYFYDFRAFYFYDIIAQAENMKFIFLIEIVQIVARNRLRR